jgi:transglutaminase-like putative cysteine protease
MARRSGLVLLLVAGGAALGAVALAQDGPRRRLHEDLPAPSIDDGSPMIGERPGEGRNPAAFAAGDKVLPEPAASAARPGEPVLGRGGLGADRDTEARPDLHTGPDGTLRYVSVFNPDVLPFKRMTALDAVRDDYTMYVRSQGLEDLPVGGTSDRTRDRFWGDVLVELAPGRDAPLPSVAPDMRILSYETTPAVLLTFSRDAADNFYVSAADPTVRTTVRLIFLVDADAGYFAPSLPHRRYTLGEVRRRAQAERLLPPLPAAVRRDAETSLRRLGIHDGVTLESAFDELVRHHRSFEARPLGGTSGNIYRDLFDEQAGVCRHRSFTFLVTATAAGIPTRYVTNEAHAFVEVWFPDRGWQRIDLGGAALRMEVSGAEGKTLHRPRAEDPFAKPDAYDQSYTQLEGDIRGLSSAQLAERRRGDGGASGDFDPLVDSTGDLVDDLAGDAVAPGDLDPGRAADPRKPTPAITITLADDQGYRGEAVRIEGRVDEPGGPLVGMRVDVFVAPRGAQGNRARLVGRGATDARGQFAVDAELPADLDLQVYELFVTTPETTSHNPGRSD